MWSPGSIQEDGGSGKRRNFLNVRAYLQGIMADRPPKITYEFVKVGNTPDDIIQFMHQLAREDGVDLNEVMKKAFPPEE